MAQTPVKRHSIETPIGRVSRKAFETGSAVATGGVAAALALLNPILGVVAAGLAPVVANRLNELYAGRLDRAIRELSERKLDLEAALVNDANATLKADAFREYVEAVLETESEEKVRFLVHLIEVGLKSDLRIEVLFAKRVIRTVSRIDELEMVILAALARMDRNVRGVRVSDLLATTQLSDANMIRSALAVLQSEGLVTGDGGAIDRYRVSDYGDAVITRLRHVLDETPKEDRGA